MKAFVLALFSFVLFAFLFIIPSPASAIIYDGNTCYENGGTCQTFDAYCSGAQTLAYACSNVSSVCCMSGSSSFGCAPGYTYIYNGSQAGSCLQGCWEELHVCTPLIGAPGCRWEWIAVQCASSGGGGAPPPPPPPPRFNITGYVWVDYDRDDQKDTNEPYYGYSLPVRLSGAASATTNTDVGTNGPYGFYDYLAGNYTVSITPPAGHVATTPTSRAVTLGPDRPNINFGIVPIYTITGSIFNDKDRDYAKESGETKDWSSPNVAITSRTSTGANAGNIAYNQSAGTFTISNLYGGLYTISYTAGTPARYIIRHPLNGPPPAFTVRVGSNCGFSPAHPNVAGRINCSARGDVSNLNFVITNSIPWYQIYGLDLRLDNGFINLLPAAPTYPGYMSVIDNY